MARDLHIDYLSKDYEAFRTDMVNRIPIIFDEWTDYSSSDMGIVILENLAYGLDIISYYQDRQANENYLPTATQRQSIIDLCSLIDYRLNIATPSKVSVVFEIIPNPNSATVIPAGFQVSTPQTDTDEKIIFETDKDLVIPAGNTGLEEDLEGNYLYTVIATQGVTVFKDTLGSSNGMPGQEFKLTFPNIIEGTLEIYVDEGGGFQLWRDITNQLVQTTDTGKHYLCEIDSKNYTYIIFGNGGIDGKIPASGNNNVQASYRIGGGTHTNVGANTVTEPVSNLSGIKRVFNPKAAYGGTDPEPNEEAKKTGPRFLRTGKRAVTREDYEILALRVPGVLKSYAERDGVNPNLVRVYIIPKKDVKIEDVGVETFQYLDGLKMITTRVEVDEGLKVYADLDIGVSIGDSYSQDTLRTYIEGAIDNIFMAENRDFGMGQQQYIIYAALGAIEGITGVAINRFTVIPQILIHTVSGDAVWSDVIINSGNLLKGNWKVTMTTPSAFEVKFDESGLFSGDEISKGTGIIGTKFTSNGGEVTFTIVGGTSPLSAGDNWTFKTQAYNSSLEIEENEFITLGRFNLTLTGGVA